jgi:hypothetical protein
VVLVPLLERRGGAPAWRPMGTQRGSRAQCCGGQRAWPTGTKGAGWAVIRAAEHGGAGWPVSVRLGGGRRRGSERA